MQTEAAGGTVGTISVQGMVNDGAKLSRPRIFNEASRILREEGIRAFWKGNGVTVVHRLPYSSLNFFAYEQYKMHLRSAIGIEGKPGSRGVDMGTKLLAGGAAGVTAATMTYPLDLVRTRLAAQTNVMYYRGITHALLRISHEEGLKGLYKGLGSTLLCTSQGDTRGSSSETKVVDGVGPGRLEDLSDEKWVSASSGHPAPTLAVSDASGSPLHTESQFSVRLPPDDVLGNVENHISPRKVDEKVEIGTGEELAGTALENMKARNAEKTQLKPSESGTSEDHKVVRRTENSMSAKAGNGHPGFVIHIASKGSAEAEFVEKLKSGDGLQLPDGAVVVTTAESTHGSAGELFDVFEYLDYLQTSQFGRLVLYSSLIPSTQTLLSQNFHSFPVGTVCVAGAQLQGKGRGGNVWQSPKGCLMFSFTTQMTDGRRVPFIQYIVSLAVIEAVEETCKASGIPVPGVRIKWPNDLYANGLKIGGVLCTSTYRAKTFNIVVGVGLNVGNREPTTCLDALIEECHGGPVAIKQGPLLAAIMSNFEILNKTFQDQGFYPLHEEYCRKWLHSGQSVVLEEREAPKSSVSHVPVTIQGLTSMGYLLASDDKGEQYELHPDGNSFDFMKGLVRQKLAG